MGQFTGDMAADLNEMLNSEDDNDNAGELPPEDGGQETPPPESGGEEAQQAQSSEDDEYILLGDRRIPAAMAPDVVDLIDWASSLTPEQSARINAALNATEPDLPPEDRGNSQPAEPATPAADEIPYEELDEVTAKALRAQQERMAQLEAQLAEKAKVVDEVQVLTGQELLRRTREESLAAEARVRDEFLEAHSLSEDDYSALVATAGELGITNSLVAKYGPEEGFRKTLDAALYANEDIRTRVLRTTVEQDVRQDLNTDRKQAASALGPQGGTNIPDQTPRALPMSERRRAMARDIETLLNNQ